MMTSTFALVNTIENQPTCRPFADITFELFSFLTLVLISEFCKSNIYFCIVEKTPILIMYRIYWRIFWGEGMY